MEEKIEKLIQIMKNKGFLTKREIEDAIRKTPREFFVPKQHKEEAYEDKPIETKNMQTISQPSVVARMTEWLDVKPKMKVLEIGAGSGWQSAIIAKLVYPETTYAVEKHADLVEFARNNLRNANVDNVQVIHGDGIIGFPKKAPFDRIIITAACEKIPDSLIDQLSEGGILLAPIGKNTQKLVMFQKTKQGMVEKKIEDGYVFVPLVGNYN